MSKLTIKPISTAIGAAFAGSLALANAASAMPFSLTDLPQGYQLAGDPQPATEKAEEGKCGSDKTHEEGKCGEGKCGSDKAQEEGKCGEGKCGEGKCGSEKADKAHEEGKCGEGKCGSDKTK